MKIIIFLGSPRKKGNSEAAAALVAERLTDALGGEIEYIRLATQQIAPCIACGGCTKTGMCVVKDDMIDLYEKIDGADLIFLAGPTYFYGLSAQLKSFIDRIQARWSRKYLLKTTFRKNDKRYGYLICCAATQGKKLFDGSVLVAKSFFDAIDVPYDGELLIRGVDDRGAFTGSADKVEQAESFARLIVAKMQP
ncbi:MAG: flavodoxin family protein [Desulfofustis sp.]